MGRSEGSAVRRLVVSWSLTATMVSGTAAAQRTLVDEFRRPPDTSKVITWWHWMNGNVTKTGITRDLEAMQKVGIGGVILFNIGRLPEGDVPFGSDTWWDHVEHAMLECHRLGLRFGIFNSDGWSMSGGPWVSVEDSMKVIVWEEVTVEGGRRLSIKLPQPQTNIIYGDIAVLAFPAPPNDLPHRTELLETVGVERPSYLSDGDERTRAAFDILATDGGAPNAIFDLGNEKMVRRVEVNPIGAGRRIESWMQVAYSNDGKHFQPIEKTLPMNLKYDGDNKSGTLSFPAISARYIEVSMRAVVPPSNSSRPLRPIDVGEIRIFESPRGHFWEPKSGQSKRTGHENQARFRDELETVTEEPLGLQWVIAREDIVDLGSNVDEDGVLTWEAPDGKWVVSRIGYTSTLRMNQPASESGKGYECDKMSVAATERHFAGYAAKADDLFRTVSGRPIDFLQMESWEAGVQNWTPGFEAEFEARRGYPIRDFLPVLTGGRVVESYGMSNKFLWDMRRTAAELMRDNYWATMLKLSHERGITVFGEGSGNQHYLYDPLMYHARTDVPMGEFWTISESARVDNKSAASVANTYGKRLVAAESFTGRGDNLWRLAPFDLKPLGDDAFLLGVNQIVLHSYVHQPYEVGPGFTLHRYGNHFQRHNPWYPRATGWIGYLTRCQHLLRQGRTVADIAYFTGEGIPSYLGLPREVTPELPPGFDYDAVNLDTLERMTVVDGKLVLPTGATYALLAFQDLQKMTMTSRLVAEIQRLLDAGATVVAKRPAGSLSLEDAGQTDTYQKRVNAIWGKDGALDVRRRIGRGEIVWGPPLAALLRAKGLGTDFVVTDGATEARIGFLHRRLDEGELYLLVNRDKGPLRIRARFRLARGVPELWDPDSGRVELVSHHEVAEGHTDLELELAGSGSVFVFFRHTPTPGARPAGRSIRTSSQPVDGTWQVSFSRDGNWSEPITMSELSDWTTHRDDLIRYFSGTARYTIEFEIDAETLANSSMVVLDLGTLHNVADVFLNDEHVGNLWKPPYTIDVSRALEPDRNTLALEVSNTAANRLIGDERFEPDVEYRPDRGTGRIVVGPWPEWLKDPSTRQGPRRSFVTYTHYTGKSPLEASGLLGPVSLHYCSMK